MKNGLVVDSSGDKYWYKNDQFHREDGPAIEYANDGNKWWYINGKLHREDGPAVEYGDGSRGAWFLNGIRYTKKEWKKQLLIRKLAGIK